MHKKGMGGSFPNKPNAKNDMGVALQSTENTSERHRGRISKQKQNAQKGMGFAFPNRNKIYKKSMGVGIPNK